MNTTQRTSAQPLANADSVLSKLRAILTGSSSQPLTAFVQSLRSNFGHYNWIGIYLVKGGNLVLEAYAGDAATEHATIPIGQGICGAAAKTAKTITVDDVNKDSRYLMCFPSTRSEIVVPVIVGKRVLGEIDIDSNKPAAFSTRDKNFLERAAQLLGDFLDQK